jgi:hypothetical protein
MLDLDRAAADSHDGIPIEAVEGEETKTGEFTAVSPPSDSLSNTPSRDDLIDLADRQGGKR